jgi:hypothetical protein
MFFATKIECENWVRQLGADLLNAETGVFRSEKSAAFRVSIAGHRNMSFVLAKAFVSWLGNFRECLFWVTEYGIWPSSEDWHLYYKLRSSYGDARKLGEAPGHLFLDYEKSALTTFLSQAIQFGWGAYVVPNPLWSQIFLSHDEWVLVDSESGFEAIREDIKRLSLPFKVIGEHPQ